VETLFKKYFWVVTLGFLTVGALLGAKTINTFIEASLRALPEAPLDAGGPSPIVRLGSKDPALIISRHIFNSEAKPEDAKGPDTKGTDQPPTAEPTNLLTSQGDGEDMEGCSIRDAEESDMDIEVIALIVTDHRHWSFVQARERRGQDAKLFKVGDFIRSEAKVVGIKPRVLLYIRNNKCEKYTMFEERPKPKAPGLPGAAPAKPTGPPSGDVDPSRVKKVGDDRYVIAREEVDKQLSNLNVLATQARIVPHFEGGQGAGFKLFAIRPGSIYSMIGIQNGDVIKQINGEMINSPDKALEAYARLKSANNITIDVVRNGQKKTLTYNIGN
jgi:general secretion pathway protein C